MLSFRSAPRETPPPPPGAQAGSRPSAFLCTHKKVERSESLEPAEHRAKIGGSNQLQGPETATSVRFGPDGPPVVTDGPYLEGKEAIGGYAEVDVADLDEALRMARTWPGRGTVEIRPVMTQG